MPGRDIGPFREDDGNMGGRAFHSDADIGVEEDAGFEAAARSTVPARRLETMAASMTCFLSLSMDFRGGTVATFSFGL